MDDTMVKNMKAMVQSGAVVQGIEAMRKELEGLTRVERAVLACSLGHDLSPEDLVELEALKGADGKAWHRLCNSIGLRVLPGEVAADSLRGRKAGRWLQ